jgi:hypothetical protein
MVGCTAAGFIFDYISGDLLISPCDIIYADLKGSDKVVEFSRRNSGEKMSSRADEVVASFSCSTKFINPSNIDQETPEMKRGEFDSGELNSAK